MRIPALAVAGALAFAAASPALAATTTVTAVSPLEQLLHDVSVSRTTALDTIEGADGDEELIREAIAQWRAELLDASDREAELRKDAEKRSPELTKAQAKAYNDAEAQIKADRAELNKRQAELLPNDPAIVLPEPLRRLAGMVDIAADAVDRDAEQSGKVIQYGIPGIGAVEAADEVASPAVTTPSVALTPAPVTPVPAQPKPSYRAERLQETSPSTTTETTTSSIGDSTTSTTTGTETTTAATTTTAETTTSATTSWTSTIMQNRTTSATSTTSSSTTSSTYSTTSSSTTTSSYDDDDERDDDLAETGTPMLSLIVLGALATLAGLLLMRRPS